MSNGSVVKWYNCGLQNHCSWFESRRTRMTIKTDIKINKIIDKAYFRGKKVVIYKDDILNKYY